MKHFSRSRQFPVAFVLSIVAFGAHGTVCAQTGSIVSINYPDGFTDTSGLQINGSAKVADGTIQLTDGGQFEAGSFFYTKRLDLAGTFQADFDFQLTHANADGFAFVLESNGPNAIGSPGGGLGYGFPPPGLEGPMIENSIAVAFDLHNNTGEGSNSVRLEYDGETGPYSIADHSAVDLTPSGIDLHSGHPFHARIATTGNGYIQVTVTDLQTHAVFSDSLGILNFQYTNGLIGGSMAYAGFTGATGENTAVQTISNWTFTQIAPPAIPVYPAYPKPSYPDGFAGSTGIFYQGGAGVSGPVLQLTNGKQFTATSAFEIKKVLPTGFFSTDFDFQIENGTGDGFAFVLQNSHLGSIGTEGGGLGYGPATPGGGGPSIPASIAIKFDTHNNAGEGANSTGYYENGASPTVPSFPLASTGINLQSGHIFHARIEPLVGYNEIILYLTDLTEYKTYTLPFSDYRPFGQAFAGFTAGTGATPSSIKIFNWTWITD